jgi:hypothetical protein
MNPGFLTVLIRSFASLVKENPDSSLEISPIRTNRFAISKNKSSISRKCPKEKFFALQNAGDDIHKSSFYGSILAKKRDGLVFLTVPGTSINPILYVNET